MDEFEKFYIIAAHFLKYRPRSEKEVRNKLLQKSAKNRSSFGRKAEIESVIEQVIQTLIQQKFLDDEAFAKWWIKQRIEFRPKSKRIIRLELLQKGIAKDVIDTLIAEEAETAVSDVEQARKLIASRRRRFARLAEREQRQKLIEFLARRGFDWDTIRQSVDEELK